jgi:hypothetical protein
LFEKEVRKLDSLVTPTQIALGAMAKGIGIEYGVSNLIEKTANDIFAAIKDLFAEKFKSKEAEKHIADMVSFTQQEKTREQLTEQKQETKQIKGADLQAFDEGLADDEQAARQFAWQEREKEEAKILPPEPPPTNYEKLNREIEERR